MLGSKSRRGEQKMRKRLAELNFVLFGCGLFSALFTSTVVSLPPAGFKRYIWGAMISLIFVFVAAICGYVFGVDRGKGRMIEPKDLATNKLFKIVLMESTDSQATFITIEVDGGNRRCWYPYSERPNGATHLRVVADDSGFPTFEFLKITPEVVEVI